MHSFSANQKHVVFFTNIVISLTLCSSCMKRHMTHHHWEKMPAGNYEHILITNFLLMFWIIWAFIAANNHKFRPCSSNVNGFEQKPRCHWQEINDCLLFILKPRWLILKVPFTTWHSFLKKYTLSQIKPVVSCHLSIKNGPINTFTPNISLVILLTVCHTILMMLALENFVLD